MSPSASEIDDEAALWAVRIDARGPDAEEDPELKAWLAGDPRRAGLAHDDVGRPGGDFPEGLMGPRRGWR